MGGDWENSSLQTAPLGDNNGKKRLRNTDKLHE